MSRSALARGAALALLAVLSSTGGTQDADQSEPQQIILFLNQNILWYNQLTSLQQVAGDPNDILALNQERLLADEIVHLAFDFARVRAQMLPAAQMAPASGDDENAASTQSRLQNLTKATAKADDQVKQQKQKLEDLRQQAAAAAGSKRARLEAEIVDENTDLALMQARADTLHNLVDFSAGAKKKGAKAGSVQEQIEQLARTVPGLDLENKAGAATTASTTNAATTVLAASPPINENSGLFERAANVLRLRRKVGALEAASASTDALADMSQKLRTPLVNDLKALTARGDALTSQPDPTDPKALAAQKAEVAALTTEYKELAAATLPLGKQALLLDLFNTNITSWRSAAQNEYSSALKAFALRLAILAVILGFVLALSEVWRRITFRYIADKRRRFQFLLMRRIVVWSLIAIILAFAFASEIGSLATFAGLLTAGLAVALQNVILSVVGYFFLIGKYGVRVGDRIQVAGVTGYIIDIGLMRLHMLEVSSSASGTKPTGRVVVFPNSVVFQANSGLFKQAPGAKFVWHEVRLTLAPESSYHESERRMLEAVNSVFTDYKENIAQQHHRMAIALAPIPINAPAPESRLDLTEFGLSVSIRYPVDLDNAAETDDRVTRAVLDEAMREPRLRIISADGTNLRPMVVKQNLT